MTYEEKRLGKSPEKYKKYWRPRSLLCEDNITGFLRCRTARPHHRTKQFLPVQTRHPIGNGNSTIHAIQDTTLSWSKIQSSGREKREGVIHFSPSIFDNDQTRSSNSKTQHNFIIRNSISQIVP